MLNVGMIIGERYEIAGRIGSGGMADVYKAKDHKLNRFVAIKVLKAEFREDMTFIRKFQTEAQAAAGLAHPNIVNVFDVGEDNGVYYIVMELVEGITLKEYISKKGKLSVKEATSIAIQVSMGLEAAHNHNIVHRDVKPQNIIISTDGKVKVTDFGIARAASSNTISSNVMGSVHYSSPEQVRGGYSDSKSDIYSLGVTIYEMVTGRVPFDGDTTVAIAIKHLQEEIVPPSEYNSHLPNSLEQIILKCTQKSVDRRYNSMAEVIADLKHSLIDPDGDFVNLVPLSNHAQTVVISGDELNEIKKGRYGETPSYQSQEDEYDDYEDDEEEEDAYEDDDEDGKGGINTRLEKALTIGGLIVGAIIICILIYLIGQAAGIFKFGSKDKTDNKPKVEDTAEKDTNDEQVEVPKLVGKTVEEAQKLASDSSLGIKKAGEEPSTEYEAGIIIKQEIDAGTKVDKNTMIKYTVSSGSDEIRVADVVGETQTDAEATLQDQGFETKVEKEKSDSVDIGKVISTDPGAGESAKKGDTITVKVSIGKGDKSVKVPNVVGQKEDDAKQALNELGLDVVVESGNSSNVNVGDVMKQDISAGRSVEAGTTITITVNTGKNSGNDSNTDNDSKTDDNKSNTSASGTWKCVGQQISKPDGYTGGEVKLDLSQEIDGEKQAKTVLADEKIEFPYSLKNVEGEPGVSTGTIYIYEKQNGEYTLLGAYKNLKFEQVD